MCKYCNVLFLAAKLIAPDKAIVLTENCIFFLLLLHKNIWSSLKVPCQWASYEYPQHIFLWRNKKICGYWLLSGDMPTLPMFASVYRRVRGMANIL